jgi:hypothetical protein
MRLVVDEKLSVFVVVAAISEARDDVEMTPFTLVVMIPVDVAKLTVLAEMTDVVATTPFTVVVKVFPVSVVLRELIMLAKAEDIPFTIVEKVLVVVDMVLVVLAAIAATVDEDRFVAFRLVVERFADDKFVVVAFVRVAFVAVKLVNIADIAFSIDVKRDVVVELVIVAEFRLISFAKAIVYVAPEFVAIKLDPAMTTVVVASGKIIDVVETLPFTVLVNTFVFVAKDS